MSKMWAAALVISVLYGAFSGRGTETGLAALQGAPAAVEVILDTGGLICLWSGVMEVMRRSGLTAGLSRLLRPVLGRLFPRAARDRDTMDALAANVSANFLGLGNAATPMGIRAAQGMARLSDRPALQAGSSACSSCSTRLPYSSCPPPRRRCAPRPALPRPSTSCPPCG